MFITMQDAIINIGEIRNVEVLNEYNTIFIYFKRSTSPTDYVRLDYDEASKEFKADLKRLADACANYKNN